MEKYGYIYVLTNESMPGLVKIGITTNIKERLRTLDTTGVPTPFKLYYAIKVKNYKEKEKNLHKGLNKYRVRSSREFFAMEAEEATYLLKAIGGEEIDSRYIDITIDENGKEEVSDKYNKKLNYTFNTTFDMLKIEPGSKLIFTKDDNIICEVYDNKKVKYNDKIYSLSSLSRDILHKYFNWKSNYVNGFSFWKYEDEILTKRRNRLEKEHEEV